MELVLEILNTDKAEPKQAMRKVFSREGGFIGRKDYSHWLIVDSGQQVSREHARVSYRDGHFCLTDMSTNGTWIKASGARLETGAEQRIENGTVYLMGDFEIRAQVIGDTVDAAPAISRPVATDGSMIIPEGVNFGQAPMASIESSPALHTPELEPQQCADYAPIEREHLLTPTLVPPSPEPELIPEPLPSVDHNPVFWQLFGQALGVDLGELDPTSREALAIETARLFKLSIGHVQQSLRTRTELKNELRLALTTGQYTRQNPIKHAATASDAVKDLLLDSQSPAHAERSINRAFSDLQAHQVAMLSASRAALRSTLEHFAPQHLTLRFEREGHKSMFATAGSLWRAYGRYHQALGQDDDWSERLLARDFARAYEEQVRLIDSLHTDPQG